MRWPTAREVAGVAVLAAAYFGAARLGQTLRYTASVSAIWPPVGLGIAALYVFGLRWWPGIFFGELLVNGQLLLEHGDLPIGSVIGQQAGNMAEVIVGAWLLRRLIGPRAALDRASQVGGMILAAGAATAISATVGTASMYAGGVIDGSEIPTFWRTWLLGDTAGALIVLPLCLTWLADPRGAWRRMRTLEGVVVVALVAALAALAVLSDAPLTYLTFPALIWAAFRFGPSGVSLCTAITAAITIGITADQVGAFYKQPIDDRTLSTQLYILVAALTSLFLSAVVSERQRSTEQLAEAKRRENERALEERRRIARDLHDSVSQALFSSVLHSRAAQKVLDDGNGNASERLRESLQTIDELTKRAQSEMRRFIFEWGPEGIGDGLVSAFRRHVSAFDAGALTVDVEGPAEPLPLQRLVETQLYGIGREALANVAKHAGADAAWLRLSVTDERVVLEIADNGRGFEAESVPTGRFGLESMRSRAEEIGGELRIVSAPGRGTVVRADVPVEVSRNGN
ncbi:MAG: MASE1 domain-containing protein [Gaiellaceae bacterium]